jgi:hypothetical protein
MTDTRLTSALTALQRVPVPLSWDDVERHLDHTEPPPTADERGHRRRVVRLALAMAAAVAVVVGVVLTRPDGRTEPVRTGPSTSTTTPPDGTTTTAPATRTLRTFPVVAVTGPEYLVWGGEAGANDVSQRADGFAVDTATGATRPIPVAPIDPRSGATGVWTGTEMIVCCGTGQADGFPSDTRSAAAWSPTSGEWRTLARPPASIARSFAASAWTGEVMAVVSTGPAAATYDPASDAWSEIPAPPSIDRLPQAVWTGTEVIVWDARYGSGRTPPDDAVADRGWRWAPGRDAWEALPDLPPGSRTRLGSMAWTGSEVVVWGESTGSEGTGVGARWRPGDDGWRPMASSPQDPVDPYDGTPGSQSTAWDPDHDVLLVRALDGGGATPPILAYDPSADRWTVTDLVVPGFQPEIAVANGQLLVPDQASPVVGPVPP